MVLCWVVSFSLLPLLFRCFILGVGLCICSGFTDEFWKLFSGVFGLLGFWYFSWVLVGFLLYFLGLLRRISSRVFSGFLFAYGTVFWVFDSGNFLVEVSSVSDFNEFSWRGFGSTQWVSAVLVLVCSYLEERWW